MFTGLFRRNPENAEVAAAAAATTPLESHKLRQIDSLRRYNPAVREILTFVSYRLDVNTALAPLSLDILLPPHFPQAKPVITVTPPVRHPWVDDEQRIAGCPELLNFSMHSDLGKLVVHVVEEFQKNPPMALAHYNHRYKLATPHHNINPVVSGPVDVVSHQLHHQQRFPNLALPNAVYTPGSKKTTLHLPFPQGSAYQGDSDHTMTSTFHTQLKDLSVEELQALNNEEDKLQEFIDQLPLMQKLTLEREEIAKVNEKLAVENLNKRPLLEDRKKNVLEMVDKVSGLRQTFDEYSHRHQMLSEEYSPAAIQENLKFAALQAEENSERVAEQFLEGKMEIEEFLSRFMDERTLSHCRRAKEEKLHQQLTELRKSGF